MVISAFTNGQVYIKKSKIKIPVTNNVLNIYISVTGKKLAEKEGGRKAEDLSEIYKSYADEVKRFLICLTSNVDLAEELTQETFYQAVKSFHRYNGECKISVWLCQIVDGNVVVDEFQVSPGKSVELDGLKNDEKYFFEIKAIQGRFFINAI